MKHALRMIGYGIGGLAVAAALSLGAFALAGGDISQPVQPVGVPVIESPRATKPPADQESNRPKHRRSPQPSPTQGDDHGGGSGTSGTSGDTSTGSGSGSSPTSGSGSGEGGEHEDSGSSGQDD